MLPDKLYWKDGSVLNLLQNCPSFFIRVGLKWSTDSGRFVKVLFVIHRCLVTQCRMQTLRVVVHRHIFPEICNRCLPGPVQSIPVHSRFRLLKNRSTGRMVKIFERAPCYCYQSILWIICSRNDKRHTTFPSSRNRPGRLG